MDLRHIVVAADESEAGHGAVRAGAGLATRSSATITVMRTLPIPAVRVFVGVRGGSDSFLAETETDTEVERLRAWLAGDLLPLDGRPPLDVAITYGVPGVEICRFAEDHDASLLVLGRKRRTPMTRMLLGDTADSVARRSRIPCLFVPPEVRPIRRILVALDGTGRGLGVLREASEFATSIGAELRVVTVESAPPGEPPDLGRALPLEQTVRLEALVRAVLGTGHPGTRLDIRRGSIVAQVLEAVVAHDADALVIGYHRGGAPGVVENGSTARRLAHTAPCAVLSIPL